MESLAPELRYMPRISLSGEHVAMLREAGQERVYEAGERIVDVGDRMSEFFYCEAGEIEVLNPRTLEPFVPEDADAPYTSARPSSWARSRSSTKAGGRCPFRPGLGPAASLSRAR